MKLKDLINLLEIKEDFCEEMRLIIYAKEPNKNSETDDSIHYGSLKSFKNSDNFLIYGEREVISWNDSSNSIFITIEGEAYNSNQKFYFQVCTSAEGYASGKVKLTIKQARAVAYATNKDNWEDYQDEGWSGGFSIDLDSMEPVEDE